MLRFSRRQNESGVGDAPLHAPAPMPQSPSTTPALKRIALRAGIGLSLGIGASPPAI